MNVCQVLLQGELAVAGIYVRVYNQQPNFPVADPPAFCKVRPVAREHCPRPSAQPAFLTVCSCALGRLELPSTRSVCALRCCCSCMTTPTRMRRLMRH